VKFGKSDKIEFISTVEGLDKIEECIPRPAKNFIPKWFKDIPNIPDVSTVKVCPAFPDYFSQGYILPMWSDVKLIYKDDFWSWQTPVHFFKWDIHGNEQFLNYQKTTFNGIEGQVVFKSICPWKIVTPSGWSVLQLPLFYHFNQEWSVLPGVIDTDIHHTINQQVLYHGNGEEVIIKVGDPFVLYIPFKRSNKLKHDIRYQTKNDIEKFKTKKLMLKNSFPPNGNYRKMQRKRDKNV